MTDMIYLDNAATTPLCAAAENELKRIFTEGWGNPSALHAWGRRAAQELENSRAALLRLLGDPAGGLIFTGGATESNNTALLGVADKHRGGRVIVSAAEHASVARCAAFLKNKGFDVAEIPYGGSDAAFLAALANSLTPDTFLVSIMTVNNETGLIFPVREAVRLVRGRCPDAVFHTDAVQAFGKIPFSVKDTGVDMCTVSGHKIHAPVGIGALYIREGVKLTPRFYGGRQQGGLRPGTEPVALAAAFAAAAEYMCGDGGAAREAAEEFRDTLTELTAGSAVRFRIPEDSSPFIISLSLPEVPSEVLMRYLEENEVLVSAGAACSKGKTSGAARDLIGRDAQYSVRVSVGADAKKEDAEKLAGLLRAAEERFRLQVRRG